MKTKQGCIAGTARRNTKEIAYLRNIVPSAFVHATVLDSLLEHAETMSGALTEMLDQNFSQGTSMELLEVVKGIEQSIADVCAALSAVSCLCEGNRNGVAGPDRLSVELLNARVKLLTRSTKRIKKYFADCEKEWETGQEPKKEPAAEQPGPEKIIVRI